MSGYVDAHCHFQDPRIDSVRERFLQDAQAQGIDLFILGGVGPEDWDHQAVVSKKFLGKFIQSRGLHPWWVSQHSTEQVTSAFERWLTEIRAHPEFALGECGLDYLPRFNEEARGRQLDFFSRQIEASKAFPLRPMILHVVDAHVETLAILAQRLGPYRGIVHSFSGNLEQARAYLDLGFKISISGGIASRKTGKAFRKLRETVLNLSPSEFVLETDLPDQPPESLKGKLNEPGSLIQLANQIGEWRGEDPVLVLTRASKIARELFIS